MAVHAATLAGLEWSRMLAPARIEAVPPPPIELVFPPSPPADEKEQDPSFFSELPPDRADQAPDKPDFLSNVDSRARDQSADGPETSLPRLEGSSEAPHIQLDSGTPAPPADPLREPAPEREAARLPDAGETRVEETPPEKDAVVAEKAEEKAEAARPPSPEVDTFLRRRRPGAMDVDQEAMWNPLGNATLPGDISMNTTAWPWAPWLQRFKRDFLQVWYAPPAYYMGIIGGWNEVELRIRPDGELMELTLLREEGHPSLAQASIQAFRALAPYHPLPEDFPEDELVLRVKLVYQQLKSRSER